MSFQLPPGSPPQPGSIFSAVLLFCGTIGAALLALLGVRFSQRAPLQTALNDAFRDFIQELQAVHASDTARISELQQQLAAERGRILTLEGSVRGLEQSRDSLLALIRRSGITVPGESS